MSCPLAGEIDTSTSLLGLHDSVTIETRDSAHAPLSMVNLASLRVNQRGLDSRTQRL